MRQNFIRLILALSLPLICIAWNQTHFELYKNSHFSLCPSTAPANATLPIPDEGAGTPLITNGSLSTTAFCDRFWNYTVLPTMPEDGAFSLTWLNTFINVIFWVISTATFISMIRGNKYEDGKIYENVEMHEPGHKRQMEPELEEGLEAPRASSEQRMRRSCLSTCWNWLRDHFEAIKFWSLLSWTIVTTVLWWHSFARIVAHPSASHAMLSPVAVLSVLGYFLILRTDTHFNYRSVRWGIVIAALLQLAAGGVALGLFYKSHGRAPQYTAALGFNQTTFNCDINALLFDPTNTTYLVSLGSFPILLGYAVFTIAVVGAAFFNFSITAVSCILFYTYAILTIFSMISFAIVGQRETSPIAWDPNCGLVHVMMGNGYGYVDVSGPMTLQTVKTFFAIHW